MPDLAELRGQLLAFAADEAAGVSPLYEHLATQAAEDAEVVGLLTEVAVPEEAGQLLLAAAHRLVYAEPFHPMSRYYPSVGGTDGVDGATWPMFREFVLERATRMRELVRARVARGTEVRRAALLYPAVAAAAKQVRGPVGLLELGCGAGLLLGLHRYAYRYQTEADGQLTAGPAKSPLGLHCAVQLAEGAQLPKPPKSVRVGARVGLDPAPVDLADEDAYGWLESCIWADQPERLRLFGVAARMQRGDPPELVRGDLAGELAGAARRVPAELPLVVFNTGSLVGGADVVAALAELAARRSVYWVHCAPYRSGLDAVLPDRPDLAEAAGSGFSGTLALTRWEAGEAKVSVLARTAEDGQRLLWL
ncbi:DUF2332 domain-containing protein [Tamaricihabitans halophyticus]|nr:DUF2332 domain-containing protein [Tamaricihabitans halophyticus]